jgi:hypothetical protein
MRDHDAATLAVVRVFLDRVHLATPGQLPDVLLEAARQVGWTARMYVADYEQRLLVPAPAAASRQVSRCPSTARWRGAAPHRRADPHGQGAGHGLAPDHGEDVEE